MIPFLVKSEPPSPYSHLTFLDEVSTLCSSGNDKNGNYDYYGDTETAKSRSYLSKYLIRDAMFSGCAPEYAKSEDLSFDLSDFDEPNGIYSLVDPNDISSIVDPNDLSSFVNPNDICSLTNFKIKTEIVQPYTPDSDHCYSAPATKQISSDTVDDKLDVLKNIPTPPSTSESPSESSSEDEVDVVTVPEEYPPPVIARFEVPRRNPRPQRVVTKPQRTQNKLSSKSLKAAMKRTKTQNIRKTYKRRKLYSVETTPSSSVPSSNQSSRCSSDVEDLDKRENHNSSERKRRDVQRTALQNLRVVIPSMADNPKAPKVQILDTAKLLIDELKLEDKTLSELKLRELQKKSDLTAKLNRMLLQLNLPPVRG